MAIKKVKTAQSPPTPPWMTSYGDLVTQLLVFFVMLFALSAAVTEDQLEKIKERIDNYALANNLQAIVATKITMKDGLVVTFAEKYMFDTARAEIYPEAKGVVRRIMGLLAEDPNRVSIEGHTDNVPISTAQFPSNWELSTARATNLLRLLVEDIGFDPERLTAAGFGEHHPVAANDTPENRAKNRRVNIIIRRLELEEMRAWQDKLSAAAKETVTRGIVEVRPQTIQ